MAGMKITARDILTVLRSFDIADNNSSQKQIDQISQSHPSPLNQLVSFRFEHKRYFLLLDETAEDDTEYITEQVKTVKSDAKGELLINPTADIITYGLPFRGKHIYLFRADSNKRRIDQVLAETYPEHSRSTWQKYIKAGNVRVNDQLITSVKAEVDEADNIAVTTLAPADFSNRELPILYLDESLIVVNKPAGILTHSKGVENDEFTVAEFFRRYTSAGLDTNRPGIVHRLDRDTSGVIIGGRTPDVCLHLKAEFSDRKARKDYLAIVIGTPKHPKAKIDLPIARSPSAPGTFRVDSKGKSAITEYEVLATSDNMSLIRLHPLTGRTHQLRVHLQYLGTPIVGDRVYGKPANRLYLHAFRLGITTNTGNLQTFTAPIPPEFEMNEEFRDAISRLG